MTGMHADEVAVEDETVRRLLAAQLPEWAGLPVRRLPPTGTDNQLFRLGDDLLVRMPRVPGPATTVAFEHHWLPRLAPHLPLTVPAPLALGEPGEGYPFAWTVVPWIEGANPTEETYDPQEWAVALGSFVRACREVPGMDGPVTTEGRGGPLGALDDWVQEWTGRADLHACPATRCWPSGRTPSTLRRTTASRAGSTATSTRATCSCATAAWLR